MAKCENCRGLVDAGKGNLPHADLVPVRYKLYPTHREHHGLMTAFRCTACGTSWVLDNDAQDQRAGWTEGTLGQWATGDEPASRRPSR